MTIATRKPAAALNAAELRAYAAEVERQALQKQVEKDRLPTWRRKQLERAAYLRQLDRTIANEDAMIAARERERTRARQQELATLSAHRRRELHAARALRRELYGDDQSVPGFRAYA